VARTRLAGAHLATAMEASVEALQELGVELGRRQAAEGGQDVEADQVVVALARGLLKLDDAEPLLDGLPDCDVRLRVPVFVDLALELREDLLRLRVGRRRLAQLSHLAGEEVRARVDGDPPGAARQLEDRAALSAGSGWHGTRLRRTRATNRATTSATSDGPGGNPLVSVWCPRQCPRQDSNLRSRLRSVTIHGP
jgi:hypothetical protein